MDRGYIEMATKVDNKVRRGPRNILDYYVCRLGKNYMTGINRVYWTYCMLGTRYFFLTLAEVNGDFVNSISSKCFLHPRSSPQIHLRTVKQKRAENIKIQ
jgi:hypothetical protein